MRFIHVADIHASKARIDETIHILSSLIKECSEQKIDAVLFAGDFWDSTITNTRASGFERILDFMNDLCHMTRVIMIYGTPSHEPAGSLEVFRYLGVSVHEDVSLDFVGDAEIICIPEPRLSKINGSLDEKYTVIQESFRDITKYFNHKHSKRIVMFHGEVEGARYQNGMTVGAGKTAMPIHVLRELNADYYALGHIHEPQKIEGLEAYYAGSACPVNFGETHEACYRIIEL